MKIIEKNIVPICPHCEKKITEIIQIKDGKWIAAVRREIFCCQHCNKVLGIGSYG